MNFNKPLFVIPEKNRQAEQKPGGGGRPKFHGETKNFELHKRKRIEDAQKIINSLSKKFPIIDDSIDSLFFEIEFNEKAISKSAQPKKLLESSKIDLYGQRSERSFLASSTKENFESFRDNISKISLNDNRHKDYSDESAYLSAISEIRTIPKEKILVDAEYIKEGKLFKGYIYLQDALSEEEAKKIYQKVEKSNNAKNSEFFISNSGAKLIFGEFSANFLNEISEPHPKNPIQRIEKALEFKISQQIDFPYNIQNITLEDLDFEAKVAVFDTGIRKHSFYQGLLLGQENFVNADHNDQLGHGTFVGSRVIFGNDIHDQLVSGVLRPKCRVLDVKIFGDSAAIDDKKIVEAVTKILESKKYTDIRVFNLSLNSSDNRKIHAGEKHYLTRELDVLGKKYQILIVVSAGNQDTFIHKKYPDCLFENQSIITPPADMVNGFSVGSIADLSSTNALAKYNEPSPFTRSGLVGALKKPDFTHFGGNMDKYQSSAGIGAKGVSHHSEKLVEWSGTSFSAPLVSQIAAQIYAYLQSCGIKQPTMDLVKALLIHSSRYTLPNDSQINETDLNRLVGFGIPDFNLALDSTKSSCSFIYFDELTNFKDKDVKQSLKSNKHKIKFTVPKELEGRKKTIRLRGTLVFTPEISVSSELEYGLAHIGLNLKYYNSTNPNLVSGHLTQGKNDYRMKWNPIQYFEQTFTSFKGGDWEIWLDLNTRGSIEDNDYKQPYALVVTLEDISKVEDRLDLHEIIKSQYKQYNMVSVKTRVKILP